MVGRLLVHDGMIKPLIHESPLWLFMLCKDHKGQSFLLFLQHDILAFNTNFMNGSMLMSYEWAFDGLVSFLSELSLNSSWFLKAWWTCYLVGLAQANGFVTESS